MLLTDRFPIGTPATFYEPAFGTIDAVVVAHDPDEDRIQIEVDEYEPGNLDDIMDGLRISSLRDLCSLHREKLRVRRWWDAQTAEEMLLERLPPEAETWLLAQRLRAWAGKA